MATMDLGAVLALRLPAAALVTLCAATLAVGAAGATNARVPLCRPGHLVLSVSTDRGGHMRAQPVGMTVSLRNTSELQCTVATGSCLPQIVISKRPGVTVWDRAQSHVLCTYAARRLLRPKGIIRVRVVWDGRLCVRRDPAGCPQSAPPAGRYSIAASWETSAVARTVLVLR